MKSLQSLIDLFRVPSAKTLAQRVGAKVQLLTIGGVRTNGPWRDDGSCLGWLPLPKRNMEKEDMTREKP